MEEEEREKEERGFIVRDKRHFFQEEGKPASPEGRREKPARAREEAIEKEAEKEEAKQEQKPGERSEERKEAQQEQVPLPEATFSYMVHQLTFQALIQLGELRDPASKEAMKDLRLARHTIDLIVMLKEKTKGNLTKEEEALVDNALYDLRMRFVKASG